MKGQVKLFFWAASISFFGTLPLGTLNLSVANFAFKHDLIGAVGFSIAAISVEMTLVRVALVAIRRLEGLKRLFRLFNLLTCLVLLGLAFSSLLAAYQMQMFRASLPFSTLNPILSGLLLSLINPLHLPFWMGWTAILKSKKILDDRRRSYNTFIIAIGTGTSLAFCIYGTAGRFLIHLLGSREVVLNWVIGIVLLITALAQLYKTFFKKLNAVAVITFFILISSGFCSFGQCAETRLHEISISDTELTQLEKTYGEHKSIPGIYKTQILIALSHFPELRDTRIHFRIRHAHSPLTTNRDWGYYFARFGFGHRAFVVTISDSTTARLSPILFSRLNFNAQIGVAGHELSHASDFLHKNLFGWLRLGMGHLSARYVDRLEYNTDSICIGHGLGYQLLAWSCFVRNALQIPTWQGAGNNRLPFNGRERYMNPSTILSRLRTVQIDLPK